MIDEQILVNSDMGIEKLEVVKEALNLSPSGIFLEIGTRAGGTAMMAIKSQQSNVVLSVDPYGSKPYIDTNGIAPFVYPDEMYRATLARLSALALQENKTFVQFKIPSQEYMSKSLNMWIVGNEVTTHDIKYSYVLLDGEHNDVTVSKEIDFFYDKMQPGGILLIDNTDWLTLDFSTWHRPRHDMAYKIF
jgi:hypothetical protein